MHLNYQSFDARYQLKVELPALDARHRLIFELPALMLGTGRHPFLKAKLLSGPSLGSLASIRSKSKSIMCDNNHLGWMCSTADSSGEVRRGVVEGGILDLKNDE